ncbi:fluoride efflux transporter CrcB [Kocuria rhizophila]|uniref:fluoride efflux transporter CrcB n=2 Tax=Kocuria rhizophila TaxID=72000 RepID=UPI0021A518C7|nr:fluoride efflux transporter CrcB [Kocuria rhizophila]MCT2249943.1 fluoride efflux transporter CrcB [Kocuria rhizophila]
MIAALAVAVGGGLGAALRFVVDRFVTSHRRGSLPLGTVLVNVVGSFGLGVVSGLGILLGPEWILALGTGLFGGFTTFSTAMLDAVRLAREHRGAAAAAVVLGTLLWSLLAVAAGMTLAANWAS